MIILLEYVFNWQYKVILYLHDKFLVRISKNQTYSIKLIFIWSEYLKLFRSTIHSLNHLMKFSRELD